jgi:flagellar biosynthesis chaperone FliJ
MRRKTLEQLENELLQIEQNCESYEKKLRQYQNQYTRLLQRNKHEQRRLRTRRLIERGAITESFIENAPELDNEQFKNIVTGVFNMSNPEEEIPEVVNADVAE